MFKIIILKNEQGDTKELEQGLSWASLFLGPIVPLFRRDIKWCVISLIAFICTGGLSNILFMFKFNEWYVDDLLNRGYVEVTKQPFNSTIKRRKKRENVNLGDRLNFNNDFKVTPKDEFKTAPKVKKSEEFKVISKVGERRSASSKFKDVENLQKRDNLQGDGFQEDFIVKPFDTERKVSQTYQGKVRDINQPHPSHGIDIEVNAAKEAVIGKPKIVHSADDKVSEKRYKLKKPESSVGDNVQGNVQSSPYISETVISNDNDYVRYNSERYKRIYKVVDFAKSRVEDYPDHIKVKHPFESKQRYDNENNWTSITHDYIIKNQKELRNVLKSVTNNIGVKLLLKKEMEELRSIPRLSGYEAVENRLIERVANSVNINTNFKLIFIFSYTSPKGQSHYLTEEVLSAQELVEEMKNIKEIKEEQSEFEIFRELERAKVTPGVRYDILKRDNFMCQICGATADHGVTLHIDHIVPIAKWGKSEESNLQTLCKDCNLGKGTKDFL